MRRTVFVQALLRAGSGRASDTRYYTKLGRAALQTAQGFLYKFEMIP